MESVAVVASKSSAEIRNEVRASTCCSYGQKHVKLSRARKKPISLL